MWLRQRSTDGLLHEQGGSALPFVLVVVGLLSALAGTLALQLLVEWRMAAHQARGAAVELAAASAIALVADELARVSSWDAVLQGTAVSAHRHGPQVVVLANGSSVDLGAEGTRLQLRSDARIAAGHRPQWGLWAWGRFDVLTGVSSPGPWPTIAVWVADDAADGDGDASVDRNGVVHIMAVAVGPGVERAWAGAVLRRAPGTGVELLSWHGEP